MTLDTMHPTGQVSPAEIRHFDAVRTTQHVFEFGEVPNVAQPMLAAPLPPLSQQCKGDSYRETEHKRVGRRAEVYDLLDRAGPEGMSREQMAAERGVKEGCVSAAVRHLIRYERVACEPRTTMSSAGQKVGVVVLLKHLRGSE